MRTAQRTAAWLTGALVRMAWDGAAAVVFQGLDNRNLMGPAVMPTAMPRRAAFALLAGIGRRRRRSCADGVALATPSGLAAGRGDSRRPAAPIMPPSN